MFGRKADSVAWYWKAYSLSLPDGAWSLLPPGAERFRALDPKDFISPVALNILAVKPASAGLGDYERDGSIRVPRRDEIEKFIEGASARYRSKLTPDYRIRVGFDYVVMRPIQLPVGMLGPDSKRFLVLEGVPPPEGERSHSCIALMDGFRMEDPTACVGSDGQRMDRLSQWPDPAEVGGCKVWQPPMDASLQGVSVARPLGGSNRVNNSVRSLAPVVIHVQKPGDVVLVLNSYEEVVWRIETDPSSRVVGVVMMGYNSGKLQGISPEVVAIDISETSADYSGPDRCRELRQSVSAYKGGPDAAVFDRQAEALLGRKLDGLQGQAELTDVFIR
jgi:hypothetical protein